MTTVGNIQHSSGVIAASIPADKADMNYLLLFMLLQGKTADLSMDKQKHAEKRQRAAVFTQSLIEQIKKHGDFDLGTIDGMAAFMKKVKELFKDKELSVGEMQALKTVDAMVSRIHGMKAKLEELHKDVSGIKKEIEQLQRDREHYQKELSDYTRKYKNGGFAVPIYNAYLAGKILEYKGKRDGADKNIQERSSKLKAEQAGYNAERAQGIRDQKSTLGNLDTRGKQMGAEARNEMELLKSTMEAALNAAEITN